MALTPLDIHNKEFRKRFRGYDEREVDEFLDEVVRDYDTLGKENAQLREEVEALRAKLEQYHRLEDTLQNTLVVAQETAESLKSNARKEAELIVRQAEQEAERIVRAAEERAREVELRRAQLEREFRQFRARVRGLLVSQLDLLDADWEGTGAAASAAPPDPGHEAEPQGGRGRAAAGGEAAPGEEA